RAVRCGDPRSDASQPRRHRPHRRNAPAQVRCADPGDHRALRDRRQGEPARSGRRRLSGQTLRSARTRAASAGAHPPHRRADLKRGRHRQSRTRYRRPQRNDRRQDARSGPPRIPAARNSRHPCRQGCRQGPADEPIVQFRRIRFDQRAGASHLPPAQKARTLGCGDRNDTRRGLYDADAGLMTTGQFSTPRSFSIHRRIIVLAVALLLAAAVVLVLFIHDYAERASARAFDRLLAASALTIAGAVQVENEAVVVEMPFAAFAMFSGQDRVFHAVEDPDARTVTGYDDLAAQLPETVSADPTFVDIDYRGELVRVASVGRLISTVNDTGWVT